MGKYKQITSDFKSNKYTIFILCVGMMPLWMNGYCVYILILLLPILFIFKRYNIWSLTIGLFSTIYAGNIFIQNGLSTSEIVFYFLFPILLYQSGQWISQKFRTYNNIIVLLCIMAMCMALPAIIANITDAFSTGEIVNIKRRIIVEGSDSVRSATGYGMMLSIMCGCFGILLIKSDNKFNSKLKFTLVVFSLAALFSNIHLVNRTGIFIAGISLIIAVLTPPAKLKYILYAFLVGACIGIIYFLFAENEELMKIFDSYTTRDSGISNIGSISGRDERWSLGLIQIFTEPFGDPKGLRYEGTYNYAHNLIIDGGIKGGVLCFFLLIAIFIKLWLMLIKIYKSKTLSRFYKYLLLTIGVTLFLQCMTEPIIEGLPQYLFYLMFYMGAITRIHTLPHKTITRNNQV